VNIFFVYLIITTEMKKNLLFLIVFFSLGAQVATILLSNVLY